MIGFHVAASRAVVCVFVVGLLVANSPVAAYTIAVGGWGGPEASEGDCLKWQGGYLAGGGIFATAQRIEPTPYLCALPGGPPRYEDMMALVEQLLRNAPRGEWTYVLGFSHGAAVVLRVLHKLHDERVNIANVVLITVDPEYELGFGVPPRERQTPVDIAVGLNVYQTIDTRLSIGGGRVAGATEVNADRVLRLESELGKHALPTDSRFDQPPHQYIDDSFAVRRWILDQVRSRWPPRASHVEAYLPGIWEIEIVGVASNDDTKEIIPYRSSRSYVVEKFFADRFVAMRGDGAGRPLTLLGGYEIGIQIIDGVFGIGDMSECNAVVGPLVGTIAASFDSMEMSLQGAGACRGSALFNFEASATARLQVVID